MQQGELHGARCRRTVWSRKAVVTEQKGNRVQQGKLHGAEMQSGSTQWNHDRWHNTLYYEGTASNNFLYIFTGKHFKCRQCEPANIHQARLTALACECTCNAKKQEILHAK